MHATICIFVSCLGDLMAHCVPWDCRNAQQLSPGALDAPYGYATVCFMHVVGLAALNAWSAPITQVSYERRGWCAGGCLKLETQVDTLYHLTHPPSTLVANPCHIRRAIKLVTAGSCGHVSAPGSR
jgi:hypothetical protein